MNELARPRDVQEEVVPAHSVTRLEETSLGIQRTAVEVHRVALDSPDRNVRDAAVALQVSASELLKAATSLHFETLSRSLQEKPADAPTFCAKAYESLANGQAGEAIEYFKSAIALDAGYTEAYKGLGDCYLQSGSPGEAVQSYEQALLRRSDYPELDNNLALACLARFDNERARTIFWRILRREHGLPDSHLKSFAGGEDLPTQEEAYASPFKLTDRMDQLGYLLNNGLIDASYQELIDAHHRLLLELRDDPSRKPYTALSRHQLAPFKGYYDKLILYRHSPRLKGSAVNPDIDWKRIEDEYLDTRCLSFDELLSENALKELRQFFVESTIFFRHSEAGFVGSYITDGFSCGLIFQILEELRLRLPRLLTDKPVNNMWCYRYTDKGVGVRPHNGDGSVTINFYLTPDDANIGDPNGGGMVMYDKVHPDEWDWLTFNLHKDDPAIQRQIADYLRDAKSTVVPYRCNRAVLFHSTLFHKTDPFHFRDSYESRRMNITMLFGKRGQESAPMQ